MPKPQTLSPLAALMREQREALAAATDTERIEPQAPTPDVAPTFRVAPTPDKAQPLHGVGAGLDAAPTPNVEADRYTSIPNDVLDKVLSDLKPIEALVLLRLYRLSRGFHKSRCVVSIDTLANSVSSGTTAARNAIAVLHRRGFIKRIGADLSNPIQSARGVEIEMLLPAATGTRGVASPLNVGTTPRVGATPRVPIKETHIKETHANTGGVRVSSRFTLQECRKYAESLRTDGITNPGGYATKIHRSGEADDMIAAFFEPIEVTKPIDVSQCLDCAGTGWRHPNGVGGGVVKCKHENLVERSENHP